MAKTWTAAEAIVAMRSGDKSAIQDIGKRFPLFATFSQTEEGLVEIIKVLSFRVTARTIEAQLKEGVEDYKEDETATDEDEKPAKPAKPKGGKPKGGKGGRKTKPAEEEDEVDEATDEEAEDRADLEEKKPKELVAIAEDLGLQKFLKSKKFVGLKGKKKKQALIDAIIAATPAEDAEEAAAEDEGDEDDWDI